MKFQGTPKSQNNLEEQNRKTYTFQLQNLLQSHSNQNSVA